MAEGRGLRLVEVSKIRPNRLNPRGPNVRENDPHRENLRESIAQFGILVPLVVRPISEGEYELIDGERRYWVAKSLKLREVPAFIVDGDLDNEQVLQRMFQIHLNRDQWNAVQQCKASESLYADLAKKHPTQPEALIDDFAKFTGTDRRTARNRVQFLRWPSSIKQEIYADSERHNSYWYVVEIEDKIIEPARKNYPEYFERVAADEVRTFLYKKWDENIVKAAVDVRQAGLIVRSKITSKANRAKALKILDQLVKDTSFGYEEAYDEFSRKFPDLVEPGLLRPSSLANSIYRLARNLSQYEPEYVTMYKTRKRPYLSDLVSAVNELIESARVFLGKAKSLKS